MQYSTSITVGGQVVHLDVPKGSRAWQLANSITCPIGPGYSEAWLIMKGQAVRALQPQSLQSIIWTQGGATLTFPGWRLLQAERLLQGGTGQNNSLFLAQFVDARYIANRTTGTGEITANLRSYANSADYLDGTSGETWGGLVSKLWTACGILGAYPGLPAGLPIDGVPESNWFVGQNAWKALCAVLEQLDCAVCPLPFSGTFTIVQLGAAQTAPLNQASLVCDFEPVYGNTDSAAALKVYFNIHRKSYGQERDTEKDDNWAYNGAGASQSAATGIYGASGTKPVWDDLPWILDEDNTQSNASAISARVANRVSRYNTRRSVPLVHRTYSGLQNSYAPGSQVRVVQWRNWSDGNSNDFGGTATEFLCGPDLPAIKEGKSLASYFSDGRIEQDNYQAPDLGRRSYPNYPRLPNMVQVYHSSGSQGTEVSPNSAKLHPGKVRRYVAGSLATLEDCWIRIIDKHDTLLGNVKATDGSIFYGRLSGVETVSGDQRPLYVVQKGEPGKTYYYEINNTSTSVSVTTGGAYDALNTFSARDLGTGATTDYFTFNTGTQVISVVKAGVYLVSLSGRCNIPLVRKQWTQAHLILKYRANSGIAWTSATAIATVIFNEAQPDVAVTGSNQFLWPLYGISKGAAFVAGSEMRVESFTSYDGGTPAPSVEFTVVTAAFTSIQV